VRKRRTLFLLPSSINNPPLNSSSKQPNYIASRVNQEWNE
jgi:hypothetical protein